MRPMPQFQLRSIDPDLMVLDVMMLGEEWPRSRPSRCGRTATAPRPARREQPQPRGPIAVYLLTARRAGGSIARFEAGADDYLGEPSNHGNSCLRIRALLRRDAPPRQRRKPPRRRCGSAMAEFDVDVANCAAPTGPSA